MWHGRLELQLRALRHHCVTHSTFLNMAEVQSQSASIVESIIESQADKDALISRLDELLEKYLRTLDQYQKTREQLSKQLSLVH
jgi:septal ring factor EnvC (AmiA/AmiB activator)